MNRRELARNSILSLFGIFVPPTIEHVDGISVTESDNVYLTGWEFLNDPEEDIY